MNIYRIYPGNDAFDINGVFLPYVDIIANDQEAAIQQAGILMPGFDTDTCVNTLNYAELIGKH